MSERWSHLASAITTWCGSALAFGLAAASIVLWLLLGPVFRFSSGWQLVVNTGTTIITFLLAFLILHAQNRDTRALHVKLDGLLEAIREAPEGLSGIEDQAEETIKAAQAELERPGGRG